MIVDGLATVSARIAEIQQRIAAPAGFVAVLDQAQQAPAAPVQPEGPPPPWGVAASLGTGPVTAPAATGTWAARLPEAGQRWAGAIDAAAQKAGIDPPLLAALTWAESGFRADARSHAGATGLTQLMPGTARGLGVDPADPVANLEGGARYLKAQLDRFGSLDLALAAYNAGPGRVASAGGVPRISETQAYVRRVTDYYTRLR